MAGSANFILRKSAPNSGVVNQSLYRLEPPYVDRQEWGENEGALTVWEYVVVSAAIVPFSGAETFIFGADEEGEILDWAELSGSYRGGLDHAEALASLGEGYRIVTPAPALTDKGAA